MPFEARRHTALRQLISNRVSRHAGLDPASTTRTYASRIKFNAESHRESAKVR